MKGGTPPRPLFSTNAPPTYLYKNALKKKESSCLPYSYSLNSIFFSFFVLLLLFCFCLSIVRLSDSLCLSTLNFIIIVSF